MNPLPTDIKKICVFRALQLGDLLCSVPAFRALRAAFPHAEISLVSLSWAKWLTERFSNYFDEFIDFAGFPGLPEKPFEAALTTRFLAAMQAKQFDLALQMQGNGTIVNPMIALFGAKYAAGFYPGNYYRPNEDYFMEYPQGIHEIDRHLALMNHLGIASKGQHLEFPISEPDEREIAALGLSLTPRKYVCIHPGSRGAWRQWPIEHFAALGDYASLQGYQVVITGTKDELPITESVQRAMKQPSINLSGRTSLGSIGVLLRDAFALVSNCTGVSHIASALKTPAIIISMDGEPERWGPLDKNYHTTIDWLKHPDFDLVFQETEKFFTRFRERSGQEMPHMIPDLQ